MEVNNNRRKYSDVSSWEVVRLANSQLPSIFEGEIPEGIQFPSPGQTVKVNFSKRPKNGEFKCGQHYGGRSFVLLTTNRTRGSSVGYQVVVRTHDDGLHTIAQASTGNIADNDFTPTPGYNPKPVSIPSETPEEKAKKDEETRLKALKIYNQNKLAVGTTPYLSRKHLDLNDVEFYWQIKKATEDTLIIPLMKWEGDKLKFAGIQRILKEKKKTREGKKLDKFFNFRCQSKRAFFTVGNFGTPDFVYFTEGLADALTIDLAAKKLKKNALVIVCFDSGNLPLIVDEFVKRYPNIYESQQMIICADNDRWMGGNGKISHAGFNAVTKVLKDNPLCLVTYLIFNDEEVGLKDFNDQYVNLIDIYQKVGHSYQESKDLAIEEVQTALNRPFTKDEFESIFKAGDKDNAPWFADDIKQIKLAIQIEADDQRENTLKSKPFLNDYLRRKEWANKFKCYPEDQQKVLMKAIKTDFVSFYMSEQLKIRDFTEKTSEKLNSLLKARGYHLEKNVQFKTYHKTIPVSAFVEPEPVKLEGERVPNGTIGKDRIGLVGTCTACGSDFVIKYYNQTKCGCKQKQPVLQTVDKIIVTPVYDDQETRVFYQFTIENNKDFFMKSDTIPNPQFIKEIQECDLNLEELIGVQKTIIRNRFCKGKGNIGQGWVSDLVPAAKEGDIIALNTPTGSGKTQYLKREVQRNRVNSENNLIVVPGVKLAGQNAHDMGTANYSEYSEFQISQHLLDEYDVTSTIHSLWKFKDLRVDNLYIDEIKQVRETCASKYFLKNNPIDAIKALQDFVRDAKRVIVCDAFLNDDDLKWLAELRDCSIQNIQVYSRTGDKAGSLVNLFKKQTSWEHELQKHVEAGKNAYVAMSAKQQVEYLKKQAVTFWGISEERILDITSDNVDEEMQSKFIANPTEEIDKYLLIIASPVITSGFDIKEFEGRQDRAVFGCFNSSVTTHQNAWQMLGRLRGNELIYNVFLRKGHQESVRTQQKTKEYIYETIMQANIPKTKSVESASKERADYLDTNAWSAHETNLEDRGNLIEGFINDALLQGVDIKIMGDIDPLAAKNLNKQKRAAKEALQQENDEFLKMVELVHSSEYKKLKKREQDPIAHLTSEEKAKIAKYEITSDYGTLIVNDELLSLDNNGKTRTTLKNLFYAIPNFDGQHADAHQAILHQVNNGTKTTFEVKDRSALYFPLLVAFYALLKNAMGIKPKFNLKTNLFSIDFKRKESFLGFNQKHCMDTPLKKFLSFVRENKEDLELALNCRIPHDFDANIRFTQRQLERIGIKLRTVPKIELRDIGIPYHEKDRFYQIAPVFHPALKYAEKEAKEQREIEELDAEEFKEQVKLESEIQHQKLIKMMTNLCKSHLKVEKEVENLEG